MAIWSIEVLGDAFLLEREGVYLTLRLMPGSAEVLYRVLLADLSATAKIGQPGFPTQLQLDEMVRAWKQQRQLPFDLSDILL